MSRSLTIIIFLIFTLVASLGLVFRTTIFINRATHNSLVVYSNSYLFSSPLQAKADGKELVRITVFLLDSRGVGVPNQTVSLTSSPPVDTTSIQTTTDDSGKAVFDLSSSTPLKTTISANHNQQTVPQTVKVVFY